LVVGSGWFLVRTAVVVPGGDGSDQNSTTVDGDQFVAEVHGPDPEPPGVTSG
jgi:hypothetical protein